MFHHPTTYALRALSVLLAGFTLTSCAAVYFMTPYSVGQKHPRLDKATLEGNAGEDARTLELYRIGEDYYLKQPIIFSPKTHYRLNNYYSIWTYTPKDYDEDERTWERATYYCRVFDWLIDDGKWKAEKIPAITRTPGLPKGEPVLTEAQAAKLNPVFVKKLPASFAMMSDIPDRFSWQHYAMLPVAAAVWVVVDIPCTIIGSLLSVPGEIIDQQQQCIPPDIPPSR